MRDVHGTIMGWWGGRSVVQVEPGWIKLYQAKIIATLVKISVIIYFFSFFYPPFCQTEREFDPNKHCGVLDPETKKPCTRSLTCKVFFLEDKISDALL